MLTIVDYAQCPRDLLSHQPLKWGVHIPRVNKTSFLPTEIWEENIGLLFSIIITKREMLMIGI